MKYQYNDGGRSQYFKGQVCDCVCRAIAIATGCDYKETYDKIRKLTGENPRNGLTKKATKKAIETFGGRWTATMGIGTGCTVHLRDGELPNGRIICNVSGHCVAVIDGTINDIYDPSRNENRCVYGFWIFK